jgi:hypothetical protein
VAESTGLLNLKPQVLGYSTKFQKCGLLPDNQGFMWGLCSSRRVNSLEKK